MSDLFHQKVLTAEKEIKREIAMREHVYPRRIEIERMTQPEADQQIAAMKAALDVVQYVKESFEPELF